jgi:hypothetical protein
MMEDKEELYRLLERKAELSAEIIKLQHKQVDLAIERSEVEKRITELKNESGKK